MRPPDHKLSIHLDLLREALFEIERSAVESVNNTLSRLKGDSEQRILAISKAVRRIPELIMDWSPENESLLHNYFNEYDNWAYEHNDKFVIRKYLNEAICRKMIPACCLKCGNTDFEVRHAGEWDGCDQEGKAVGGPIYCAKCRQCNTQMSTDGPGDSPADLHWKIIEQ
jgi:hypothetical protein